MRKSKNIQKLIIFIICGCVLLIGGTIILIYKTCYITYITDKIYSPDGAYYVQAQDTECVLLDRYTTDVIITSVKQTFLEKLNGSSTEDVLILKGHNPTVKYAWVDNRTLKVQYLNCRGPYGQHESWRDIKIIYEGSCSENN